MARQSARKRCCRGEGTRLTEFKWSRPQRGMADRQPATLNDTKNRRIEQGINAPHLNQGGWNFYTGWKSQSISHTINKTVIVIIMIIVNETNPHHHTTISPTHQERTAVSSKQTPKSVRHKTNHKRTKARQYEKQGKKASIKTTKSNIANNQQQTNKKHPHPRLEAPLLSSSGEAFRSDTNNPTLSTTRTRRPGLLLSLTCMHC